MAQRRLARLVQTGNVQSINWTVQATSTYSTATPGADPAVWGTEAEIAFLDRLFLATGNEVTQSGILLTFLNAPTRSFGGAQVKIRPTFTNTVEPKLEMWTLKDATWTLRRRVALTGIARSGDTLVQELFLEPSLFAVDDAMPDAIWITLDTIGVDTSLTWLVCHLYGDCTRGPITSDCPPGTPPEDCDNVECSADVIDWTCIPIPIPPDLPNPAPVRLPPIDIDVPMAETYVADGDTFTHPCPGPTTIAMYFGDIPGGGSVQVALLNNAGLIFAEGVVQTISAPGVMNWTISAGYAPGDPDVGNGSANGYLPPRAVLDHLTFRFTRIVADPALDITLLDILMYWWTVDLVYEILCDTEPVEGLPPAQDPPDDAGQTTYQRVYERWLVYADTEANATAARDAHARRVAKASPLPVYYGLRPEDATLFAAALEETSALLFSGFDPVTCSALNTAAIPLDFNQLADGHVIAMRLYVMPVAGLMLPKNRNLFAGARHPLPYNPAPDVQNVVCPPGSSPNDTQSGDLAQRFRIERAFLVTPQIEKFGGPAIQPGAYHLARGVTENEGFDTIQLHPYPVPDNPYAFTWDPPCSTPLSGRCHQWFAPGWAYLLTIRVYEPVATPIGAAVELDPPVVNPTPNNTRMLLSSPDQLDGTWP